ncbi:hypothetical protein EC988_002513 [Linderina pennispora]|nr:hypothetical protein EC988_002513 [Linderina pennispora]
MSDWDNSSDFRQRRAIDDYESGSDGLDTPSTVAQPSKIRLSLKLGSLRQTADYDQVRSAPAAPTAPADYDPYGYYDDYDEDVDIGEPSRAAETATPKIKLKLSFKKPAWSQGVRGAGSTVPTSPTDSIGSYTSRPRYSPSVQSGPPSDNESFENRTVSEAPVPKRRGRPPKNGRKKQRTAYVVRRPPGNAPTTTVSLRSSLERLITRIKKRDSYGFFLDPVDTTVITDYLSVIDEPMDLGTMQSKVERNAYYSIDEFRRDLLLVCDNARKYNGAGSIYATSADRVQDYAVQAIERETVKLERVGMASMPAGTACEEPVRARSATPGWDAHEERGEHRRSSRLRWRSSADATAPATMQLTPAAITDNFRWTHAARRRAKRQSDVPRHVILESQVKVSVLPDGSVDPAGFEEDTAHVPFLLGPVEPPRLAAVKRPSGAHQPPAPYSHGFYHPQATFLDFGHISSLHGAIRHDRIEGMLPALHADATGLAYWNSISEFVDGAGDEAVEYAAKVIDHLTHGAHAVARSTVNHITQREPATALSESELGPVDVPRLVSWLDAQEERDHLYAGRVQALTQPIRLRDLSSTSAEVSSRLSDAERRDISTKVTQNLQAAAKSEDQRTALHDSLQNDIHLLAEQLCLEKLGSTAPDTLVPALLPMQQGVAGRPRQMSNAPPMLPRVSSASAVAGVNGSARRNERSMSMVNVHSASLASAVQSDIMRDLGEDD